MRAVTGEITSSRPISLSKAAGVLSRFAATDTGVRPDVAAYLRRTVTAFEELVSVHQNIRAQRKMPLLDETEVAAPWEENDSRRKKKKKKKKGMGYDGDEAVEDSVLERQAARDSGGRKKVEGLGVSLDGRFSSAMLEADGIVQVTKKWEEGKRSFAEIVEEANGAIEKKKKDKMDKKKEKGEDEAKIEERSEDWKRKKEKKRREGLIEEDGRADFDLENMDRKRKKRKHSDAGQGGSNGAMEQHQGEKKKRRRTFD